jgi:hypothetical protein
MSAQVSGFKDKVLVIAAALTITATGNAFAAPVGGGHAVGGGGFHGGYGGGYRGGWHGPAYGWHGYYGGWHGYYGGYYGPWRGGWGWAGYRWGCCGWGWPWVSLGWYVPALPLGYTTLYWGGWPYYYANNYYYVWDSNVGQYEAIQPSSGASGTAPGTSSGARNYATATPAAGGWTDLFAYPKGGQSPEQQARDREECRTWAISQSGFDPAKPSQDNPKDYATKREGYLRAEAACLQARNYSVK